MLHLQNVSVIYNQSVKALTNVNLQFQQGQFTVLLGQSGAGKSTLLRCLNLLNKPTVGQVVGDDDQPISTRNKAARKLRDYRLSMAMVFQMHQLILRQSAVKNVLVGVLGKQTIWRSFLPAAQANLRFALQCLDRVGLLHKALTRCDQLSGGERQRVGIARALAQRPRYLLADEPVASLDPGTARKVLTLIQKVCEEDQITAIVSLHQVELAMIYAQRVIALAEGQVIFDGMPSELSDEHLHRIYKTKAQGSKTHSDKKTLSPMPQSPSYTPKEIEDEIELAKRLERLVGNPV